MKRGLVIIPTVLMFGGLVVSIALVAALLAYFLADTNYGTRLTTSALAAARSGVQDAVIRILRNSAFVNTSGYTLTVSSSGVATSALVVVQDCVSSCPSGNLLRKEITVTGTALSRQRKLRAVVDVNQDTGQVFIVSEEEQPL